MIRRAPKVARFADKPVTTRLANALRTHGIETLVQLEQVIRSDRFRFIKNVAAKSELEARVLVGIRDKTRHIKTCPICGDEHICEPKLKALPKEEP